MFDRIANGWALTKQSFAVLKLDKELLLFPLLSGMACLLVMGSFALPLWASGQLDVLFADGRPIDNPVFYVIAFAFYFVNYFVIIFFNCALVACAIIRFKGGDPTVGDGLQAASSRIFQIAGWALVSASVGLILRAIESRSAKFGQIASALLGMAWSAGTYFVVPILVVERANPVEALKRSVSTLRKTWGEALVANFGIGLLVTLATMAAMCPALLGLFSGNSALMILGISVSVISVVVISLVSSAMNSIVVAALYLYAAEGRVADQFDESSLAGAFRQR